MNSASLPMQQAQSFRDIHIGGAGNSLVINQTVQLTAASVQAQPFVAHSPYVGLRRFDERDVALFFGRDAVVAKLLAAVKDRQFTLVAGASGSGKSSLVRAGLLPLLPPRLAGVRVITLVPDRDPFARLRAALLAADFDLKGVGSTSEDTEQTLLSLCQELRAAEEPWLIFIDQFEEIFTLCTDAARKRAFIDGLCRLIDAGPAEVKIVAAIRSDFFDRFDPYPQLLERTQPPFFVTSPSPAELRLCIEQPAAHHGVTFEEGLVSEILLDVQGQPGALPLLSYTLDLLWKKDAPAGDRTLKTRSYRETGGISGALKQRADDLYEQRGTDRKRTRTEPRPQAQREAMRRLFLRLLDLSEQGENARPVSRRTPHSEFPADEQALIGELADEKLLITDRPAGVATVEVAHEALLSTWPRLGAWIAEAREAIFMRNRLHGDAAVWEKAKQAGSPQTDEELWTGTRLQTALDQEQRGEFKRLGGLSAQMREFLQTSRALRERRTREEQERREALARKELEKQQQRTRFLRIGVVLLTVFVAIAGSIAFYAKKKQQEAEQRELDMLVEEGRQLVVERGQPIEAALKLQRALERGSKSPSLPYLLKRAMQPIDAMQRILHGHEANVLSAEYSPDGRRIVSASVDNTVRVWDAASGQLLLSLRGHQGGVNSAQYSPDGRRIVSASYDKTVRVWDAASGQLLLSLQGHQGGVNSAQYSPDGRRIVSASNDKAVRVWDVSADLRGSAQLGQVLRCRVPLRLQGTALIPVELDLSACKTLPQPPPAPVRLEDGLTELWIGVYAMNAGHEERARSAYLESHKTLKELREPLSLTLLELAETALDASNEAPCPGKVLDSVRAMPLAEQAAWVPSLASFAEEDLYRPRWALTLIDLRLSAAPKDLVSGLQANRIEGLLSSGQIDAAWKEGPAVWRLQSDAGIRSVLATYLTLAAAYKHNEQERRIWARRAMENYAQLADNQKLGWTFYGIRHAYEIQPESQVRTQALELFTLLEQPKSGEIRKKLGAVLGTTSSNASAAAQLTPGSGAGARSGLAGR